MNLIGLKTLYKKEIIRFLRVYNQTIIAPIINAALFFFIFTLAFTHNDNTSETTYNLFLISGLVIMSSINNAYNNGIFIVVSKVTGNIIDLITAPLSPNEILFGLCGGAITRSFITAISIYITLCLLQWQFPMHSILITIFFVFISSLVCALIGIISGLIFDNFEEASLITNYIITPLLFLSGTFYSITKLPGFFQFLTNFNPFFYMIDGARYGIIGRSEHSIITGSIFLISISFALWYCAHWIIRSGYKIKK